MVKEAYDLSLNNITDRLIEIEPVNIVKEAYNPLVNNITDKLIGIIEEKNDLISILSHELGTPLSKMQLAADIIENTIEAGKLPSGKIVKLLSKSIGEMVSTLEDILTLSSININFELKKDLFDPEDAVKNALRHFEAVIELKNIKIEIKSEENLKLIRANKEKIERVIQNLLNNAINYSPEKGTIQIVLKDTITGFSFTIKDEGPGIKKENAEKIFEAFFREDPSRNRKTGGTGLGLAISRKIIDLYAGKIYVENPGRKGAIITFHI